MSELVFDDLKVIDCASFIAGPAIKLAQSITFRPSKTRSLINLPPSDCQATKRNASPSRTT